MKAFLKTETCTLSTLTPVHIGSGEDYYPTNYVIDDGYLYYFGEMLMLQALSEAELNQLARIAEERRGQEGLRRIQAFIYERRQTLKEHSAHLVPAPDNIEHFYQARIGQTAQRESDGRNISNQLAIQRSSFNPHTQTPYLPGSSVKGAIRTALLDKLNDGRRLKRVPDRKTGGERPQNNQELQQDLLKFSARNLHDDPLRLLKVGDSQYQHADGLNGLEIRFAVNRKRKPSDKPTRADNGPPILLECLASARSQAFQMALTLQIGDPLEALRAKLPFRDFAGLAACCNRFYLKQLDSELNRLPGLGYVPRAWTESLLALLKGELGQAMQQGKAFLLRLGRYGGAESKTLEGVRTIRIMQGPDKPPKFQPESTTVWLAADDKEQRTGMLPFGWVLVELSDSRLPQTHAFLRRNAESAYAQLASEQQRKAHMATQRLERERKQTVARQEAEAKAAEERAEAERLASMSDNVRRAEELKSQLTPASKGRGKGHQLFQQINQLIQAAAAWTPDEQRAVRAVAVAAFDHLGVKPDDTGRKKLLRTLVGS